MSRAVILVCEDNLIVQDILKEYLGKAGFETVPVMDGESALAIFDEQEIDLILLDLMLPGISGFDVCKMLRTKSDVPIIIVSARGTAPDRIAGLELGADDYITKPFSPKEVILRINKLLERKGPSGRENMLKFEELEVYPDANMISIKGRKTEMTNKEIQVLQYLIENQGSIMSRFQILHAAWGSDYDGDERVVDTVIKRIRKKTAADNVHFKLSSVYGKGYKIEKQF